MPESADEVTVMEARTVRRRLTQSTLFPQKVPESSAERDKQVRHEEDGTDGEDVECGVSQGRRKRKVKGKGTPQAKSAKKINTKGVGCLNGVIDNRDSPVDRGMKSPRKPRDKKQANSTPKKTKTNKSTDPGTAETSPSPLATGEKTKSIPDLRLEAKLIAEENSRIFGGKQLHPFFSLRKSSKVTRVTSEEEEADSCTGYKNNSSKSPGPIHVFDSSQLQEDVPVPDWSRWIFLERSIFSYSRVHKVKDYFDPGSSPDCGKVSNPSAVSSIADGASEVHLAHAGNSSPNPVLTDENVEHVIGHTPHHEYCLNEKKSSIPWNRTVSFNCGDNDVLWTKKYQPERAKEVCGNIESVNYLSEWLHLWHAKALQCRESANRGTKNASQSSDLDYYESDCDSEKLSQGAKLKNVLLISGPTGSGKSASIYACAGEQGFNVIEVNTSDWRNGALVKQKFGEAVGSHRVKRLNESETSHKEHMDSLNHHVMSQSAVEEVVELTTIAIEDGSYNSVDMFAKVPCARSNLSRGRVHLKTLVLFEDVDVTFTEDRGFISAIQHLANTAKLPIILTTDSNQSILPDSLDREEICFSKPSHQDLLRHVIEICTAEKANIEPCLIPSFVEFFHGDIRKTIMHLQFWCQNAARLKDTTMREKYGPQTLDLEAAHQLLMKFIPWSFASELSELIEFELNKMLSLQEEQSTFTGGKVEKHLSEIRHHSFQAHLNEECIAAKKDAMLKRNAYYDQFDAEAETQDISNSSGSPITFSRRNIRRKSDYVLSLSGDDDIYDYECPTVSAQEAPHARDDLIDCGFSTCIPKPEDNFSLSIMHHKESPPNPTDKITPFQTGEMFETHIQVSEYNSQIQDSWGAVNVSCVPESSFVPETRIDEQEESCRSVSYVPSGEITTVDVKCYDECLSRLHIDPQNMVSGYDINVESIHFEDVGDSHTEDLNVSTRRWQLMDECSQMNFNRSAPTELNDVCKKTGSVQEVWDRLRESHQGLGKYVTTGQKYASQFLRVAFGASNLISEADILLSDFHLARDTSADPSTMPFEKPDAFQWYNEQLHMTSTFSGHGLSLYAKEANAAISNTDQTSLVDSEQEMLINSAETTRLGNIGAQGAGISDLWLREASDCGLRVCAESESKPNSICLGIIQSIVPPRSYLAVRGEAMNEYLSSLKMISRSETSRMSAGVDKSKRRRGRVSRHYLSGELSLSPEDISILNRDPFGSQSHQEDA